MGGDWPSFQGDITELLSDLGGTGKIVRQNSNVDWSTPCVLFDDVSSDSPSSGGIYVTQRNLSAFVGNTKDMPSPGDQLVFGSQTYNIKAVAEYMPDGVTNLCWQLSLSV